ncbi:pyridoxamine 5'-phosphate oxidase family protein [Streptomyces sp. TLI_171]|uniref:pyridoxamine 5'-phosphate oxidase family protein n=1 Tax=Streptomyces sp. TLI_171 TaxID=1938859 RepID=UPI000C186066|nr:pyridoxamine 5'-phosphate oxidase family protein [Streptomyces sp. TLI_171]RKE20943.1 pyridoxamine 5'-phosphate oxidase [Streptomyces sp. TLI_171]
MGKTYERIDARLRAFIERQPVYFVASAPLSADGHVNLSPKGRSGTLAVIDELTVAYLDFGGSHAETIAHLRENGRITLMWCAFDGPPTVLRVHGRGEPVFRDDERFAELLAHFDPSADGTALRAIILVRAERVSDSCGFAVPFMDYRSDRELHEEFFDRKGEDRFSEYCESKDYVAVSIDGLPSLPLPLPPRPA